MKIDKYGNINPTTLVISWNVNGLNTSTKRQRYMWEHADGVIAKCQGEEKTAWKTRNRHLLGIANTIYLSKRNRNKSAQLVYIIERSLIASLIGRNLGMIASVVKMGSHSYPFECG